MVEIKGPQWGPEAGVVWVHGCVCATAAATVGLDIWMDASVEMLRGSLWIRCCWLGPAVRAHQPI